MILTISRTPYTDSPVFHFLSLLGVAPPFFGFTNYTHLAKPPSTSISYLFYNPLCTSIAFPYLISQSGVYVL